MNAAAACPRARSLSQRARPPYLRGVDPADTHRERGQLAWYVGARVNPQRVSVHNASDWPCVIRRFGAIRGQCEKPGHKERQRAACDDGERRRSLPAPTAAVPPLLQLRREPPV